MRRFGVPGEMIQVIYPGHDPERFKPGSPGPLRERLGVREGEVLVGLITSGDFTKRGVGVFLGAVWLLAPSAKERLRVLIVGRESRLGPYKRLAAETGLGERVQFMEPRPDVESYYRALDVYVHPALYEEFGQSAQEAMACGIPVLATRRVGASELFKDQSLLLDKPEPESLARALEKLILDPAERRRLGQAGIEACRGNTWEANFKATFQLVSGLTR